MTARSSSGWSRPHSRTSASTSRPRSVPTPEIKLVVFDWAGTTIDFGCLAPAGAFVAAFAARGVTVSVAEARGPMGRAKKDHVRDLLRNPAVAERWKLATGGDWSEPDVDALY